MLASPSCWQFSDKLLLFDNPYRVLAPADHGALALPPTLRSVGAVVLLLALERGAAALPPLPPLLRLAASPLALLVHDSAKPGRAAGGPDLWVAHSTAGYLARHLRGDDPPGLDDEQAVLEELQSAALAALREAAAEAGGSCTKAGLPVVAHASVFTWDHAQPAEGSQLHSTHLLDAARLTGLCGDFFAGAGGEEWAGVEAAAMSGVALAEALLPLVAEHEGSGEQAVVK